MTDNEYWSTDTEILNLKEQRWIKGPNLPRGIHDASCVALPPTLDFACLLIGGQGYFEFIDPCGTRYYYESEFDRSHIKVRVYGLKKSLDEWILLGTIETGRFSHIALPFS